MILRYLFLLYGLILLASCQQQTETKYHSLKKLKAFPTLLNFNSCFTSAEKELSFPVWFNDSILLAHGVKEIIRTNLISEEGSEDEELRQRRVYTYDKKGNLTKLVIEEYYEGSLINSSEFHYKGSKDEFGFAEVKRQAKQTEYPDHNRIYTKSYFENYLSYTGEDHDQRLYFLPDSKHWKALTIDSMLRPDETDFIVYGTPDHRLRQFRIANKIEESDITEFLLDASDKVIVEMKIDNYPFATKRTYNYGESDKCIGFLDSLFSGDKFLNSVKTTISYQKAVLPITVYHRHLNISGELIYTETEQFSYAFYE